MEFDYSFNSHWFKSPGYLSSEVPQIVKEELQKTIEDIQNGLIEVNDYRTQLAGHLEKETSLPITPNIKYFVESLSTEYDNIFSNGKHSMHDVYDKDVFKGKVKYELKTLWINYGKKHDFNPLHTHSGIYSFVIWIKIPYDIENEMKRYDTSGNKTATFNFVYSSALGQIRSEIVEVKEWKIVFFPAKLNHCVYPFYSSDDYRISISGNVYANI